MAGKLQILPHVQESSTSKSTWWSPRDQILRDDAPKSLIGSNTLYVSRVVKGGRRFRFKALVGNRKDKVNCWCCQGADVQAAVTLRATSVAKSMITLPLNGETIPHDSEVKFSGARVIKQAAPGTGIIAGGVVHELSA